jgi:hypothetical protein
MNKNALWILMAALILFTLLTGCIMPTFAPQPTPVVNLTPTSALPSSFSQIRFEVQIPAAPQGPLFIEILDEVTGLPYNYVRYEMRSKDDLHYFIDLPAVTASVIKYRYILGGKNPATEFTALQAPVRYRMFVVHGPSSVQDIIASWSPVASEQATGRIHGIVRDAISNAPLPGILVISGGVETYSAADGSFLLEGLLPGTHNLVAYSLDGSYPVYQQGATVAAESQTEADLRLSPAQMVQVTFFVSLPAEAPRGVPVRLIGNTPALGNTFADLDGGMSTVASRAPLLAYHTESGYSITLSLPVGFYLQYKYSLGDGFWNAEHTLDGAFRVRQLIVPETDTIIYDSIDTWRSGNFAPVTFFVNVPPVTPATDIISIQFDPSNWTIPVPMWSMGSNRWLFILYSPLNVSAGNIGYRYCRNDQCGIADDAATQGNSTSGWPFTGGVVAQTFEDEVGAWAWWQPGSVSTTVLAENIISRGNEFIAGIELDRHYHPTWQPYESTTYQHIRDMGANWVVLTPSWTFTKATPPTLEPVAGRNPLWGDTLRSIQPQLYQLNFAIFPQIDYSVSQGDFWGTETRSDGWWDAWFDRYREFIIHYADTAAITNAKALIIGANGIEPAFPAGLLPNGVPSGVPDNAEMRWRSIIADVRLHFKGTLMWATDYTDGFGQPPPWIDAVDQIYVLWSAPLSTGSMTQIPELYAEFARRLDTELTTFHQTTNKPMVIAIKYPSVNGSAMGCVQLPSSCLDLSVVENPGINYPGASLDLMEQADIYNAALNAINGRDWITGFVSRGYYSPAVLQDLSASIHGKPASDIVWYWFPRILGE